MKKLIISMVATASIALVAKADVLNATSFEGYQGSFNVEGEDSDGPAGEKFWSGGGTDGQFDFIDVAQGDKTVARPKYWANQTGDNLKALAIDTDEALARHVATKDAGAQPIGNGLYFDSMVQFTATEGAPEPTPGDKLIVWLKEISGEGESATPTYKLCVTAAELNEEAEPTAKVFETSAQIVPETWNRLSIAAKVVKVGESNITEFKVYVNSTLLETGAPLYSLVPYTTEADDNGYYNRITSVSFQGKGAIDDLVWTTEDPYYEAPSTTDVTISLTCAEGLTLGGEDGNVWWYYNNGSNEVEYNGNVLTAKKLQIGEKVVFTCETPVGYTVEGLNKVSFNEEEGIIEWTSEEIEVTANLKLSFTITKDAPAAPKPFTVNGVAYKTLADAIAAANGAPITLTEDATLTEKLTVAKAAVIDLNGQTLTLANIEGNYAVVITAALTITDSSDLQTGKVIVPGLNGFGMTAGSLTIDAGSFVGATADYLIGAWDGTVTISGGNFSAAYCVLNLFGNKPKAYISNGTFTVAEKDVTGQWDSEAVFNEDGAEMAISGGRFSTVLDEAFCAEGYIPTTEPVSGYYTVVLGYAVTVDATKATVTGLAAKYAAGATVSFTVTAAEGYEVKSVVAEDDKATVSEANGVYSFTMPAEAVKIVVTAVETYKEPTVEPNGGETITEPFSETAKKVIKDQFPAGGVVIKVEVNGDTLKGNAAVEMINEIVEMFEGNPFVVDQGVVKLELVFKVDDVMAIVNGLTGGYTLKAGEATFNTEAYEVVPRWYDIDKKVWDVDAPQDGATKGFFKLTVQKKAN